jgi:hypothetical protein
MPVTVKVASHDAREWWIKPDPKSSSRDLLLNTLARDKEEADEVFQSSISDEFIKKTPFSYAKSGLVSAAFDAYNSHQNLVLRPEDIWFAILCQFSFYVNAHSEELRESFVAHEGKKGLVLKQEFEDDASIDFGEMCKNMTKLIDQNITDPKLRAWILPSFTTTTDVDTVVASALMMGMLQKYFDYIFDAACCGIPNVTLLGEQKDYQDISERIEKLTEYGDEPAYFAELLRPILRGMIASFTAPPGDQSMKDFWGRIVHHESGSGFSALSGWITAFCLWDADGKCNSEIPAKKRDSEDEADMNEFGHLLDAVDDMVRYPVIDMNEIPCGWLTVPVTLALNEGQTTLETKILAGSFGVMGRTATEFYQPAVQARDKENEAKPLLKNEMVIPYLDSQRRMEKLEAEHYGDVWEPLSYGGSKEQTVPAVVDPLRIDTLQPLTGWWLYTLKNGNKGMSLAELIKQKKTGGEWKGGSSTGRVFLNGDMYVSQDDKGEAPVKI